MSVGSCASSIRAGPAIALRRRTLIGHSIVAWNHSLPNGTSRWNISRSIAFAAFFKADIAKWADVIKRSNVRL